MKEVPLTNFKIVLVEANERLKVCAAIGLFVEDIADLESVLGKNLIKLGSQPLQSGKPEWLPNYSSLWESIHKMSTVLEGKQHLNLSYSVSQNICKVFPDHVKASKKRLQSVSVKILAQVDELRKAKMVNHKNLEKYHKLIQDTEVAIKSRDSAHEAEARNSVERDSSQPHSAKEDSGFMNRSLTKMLAKIAPEKKLHDRCRDLLRELDVTESSIVANTRRLNVCRTELLFDIGKALREVEEVEESRAALLREGLSRFCIAQDLLISKQAEVSRAVAVQAEHVSPVEEMTTLLREVEKACQQAVSAASLRRKDPTGSSGLPAETDNDTSATTHSADDNHFVELFCRSERICEAMEAFRLMAVRGTGALMEISEAQRSYSRAALKLLEKHGFGTIGAVEESAVPPPVGSCADLLAQSESPLTRASWETFARSFLGVADLHVRSAEILSDEVCQRLNLVQKRVEIARKELSEALSSGSRRYETVHSAAEKLTVKLTKLQAFLKERRATLKAAKESTSLDGPGSIPSVAELERDLESEGEAADVTSPSSATSTASSSTAASKERKNSVKMMQGLESFGANLRNGKLKQVVGLEAPSDRSARIEKQIAGLEEEERELVEALRVANLAISTCNSTVDTELTAALTNAQELLRSDLDTMRGAISVLVLWQSEMEGLARGANQAVRVAQEATDTRNDLAHFVGLLCKSRGEGSSGSADCDLLDIPVAEVFEPIRSELVEEERRAVASTGTNGGMASVVHAATVVHQSSGPITAPALATPAKTKATEEDHGPMVSPEHSSPVRAGTGSHRLSGEDTERNRTEEVAAMVAAGLPGEEGDASVSADAPLLENGVKAAEFVDPANLEKRLDATLAVPPSGGVVDILEGSDANKVKPVGSAVPPPPSSPVTSPGGSQHLREVSSPSGGNGGSHKYQEPQVASELSKFGLSSADKVLESFSCALYPKKGLLTHGRLFITQHYMAFSGWPDTRVLLALSQVRKIDKCNTLGYIPNALTVVLEPDGEEYFFGSFIDRMQCHALLTNLSEIAKRIASIQGETFVGDPRPLEFGYQSRNNIFGNVSSGSFGQIFDDDGSSSGAGGGVMSPASDESSGRVMSSRDFGAFLRGDNAERPPKGIPAIGERVVRSGSLGIELTPLAGAESGPLLDSEQQSTSSSSAASGVVRRKKKRKPKVVPAIRRPSLPEMEMFSADVPDGVSFASLFETTGITLMLEKTFAFSAIDLWKAYFLSGSGYGDFLVSEGDLFVETGEWQPLTRPVSEDVSKLSFAFSRPFAYSHPRTTMLMFGPKNAPATQMQYLYLPCDMSTETLQSVRPRRGLVLNVTQFDGIPMADVFKVLQYWAFEADPADASRTVVRVGLAMHYIKGSLFKTQIFGGTRDELTDQLKKWFDFVEHRVAEYRRSNAALVDISTDGHISEGDEEGSQAEEGDYESDDSAADVRTDAGSVAGSQLGLRRRSSEASQSGPRLVTPRPSVLAPQSHIPPSSASSCSGSDAGFTLREYILVGLVAVLVVLLIVQWQSTRALSFQVAELGRLMDVRQVAAEASAASTQRLLEELVSRFTESA